MREGELLSRVRDGELLPRVREGELLPRVREGELLPRVREGELLPRVREGELFKAACRSFLARQETSTPEFLHNGHLFSLFTRPAMQLSQRILFMRCTKSLKW